ncbi:hypothetical protein M758_UG173400 [Ceratodon purpureus]|nr:hypothetical protein M758_UG173400 [Ceratodon purpureus]
MWKSSLWRSCTWLAVALCAGLTHSMASSFSEISSPYRPQVAPSSRRRRDVW